MLRFPDTAQTLAARYPTRAVAWRLKSVTLDLSAGPLLMGIVNVTPDSFSDGGKFVATQAAVDHALRLAADDAAILDVGGESTRPYADSVGEQEELDRVLPVIEQLAGQTATPISIDTSKAEVARQAIAAGAQIVNDVTGLEGDPQMMDVARQASVGVCAMHMRGTPRTMQDDPQYGDVVSEIQTYLRERRDALLAAGIDRQRICLDPGIGFGKTHEHNLTLMAACDVYHDLRQPLLVGHSRKGFLAKLLGDKQADRAAATAGAAACLARQGVQVIRVHDVRTVRETLLAFEACGGLLA